MSALPSSGRIVSPSAQLPAQPVNDVAISFFFYDTLVVKSPTFFDALCAKINGLSSQTPETTSRFLSTVKEWRRVAATYVASFEAAPGEESRVQLLSYKYAEACRRLRQLVNIDVDSSLQGRLLETVNNYSSVHYRAVNQREIQEYLDATPIVR